MATSSPKKSVLPHHLLELAYDRSHRYDWGRYDPHQDLARRTGVDLRWHNNAAQFGSFDGHVWGLTDYEDLSVSLNVHLSEVQLRCTVAHECAHLDRGPVQAGRTSREEAAVTRLAAQRLIDPVVFDALMEATAGEPSRHARYMTLGVDQGTFASYKNWRRNVKQTTALRRWEAAKEPAPWPAPWIEQWADKWPLSARFVGCEPPPR